MAKWNSEIPNELKETESLDFWLDRADYYEEEFMKHYYYFDSFISLFSMLESFQDTLFEKRIAFINNRKVIAIQEYTRILFEIWEQNHL